jgi:hypothetical protein
LRGRTRSFARTVSSTADAIWLIGLLFILPLVVVQIVFVLARILREVGYELLTPVPFPTFVNAWPACSLLVDRRTIRLPAHNSAYSTVAAAVRFDPATLTHEETGCSAIHEPQRERASVEAPAVHKNASEGRRAVWSSSARASSRSL